MKTYKYDAFLSFAVEDKLEIANELYHKLEQKGLKVWYSGRELTVGENLEDSIREGLDHSRYGIVIVTHNYFKTRWTLQELGVLWDKERNGRKVILPVLYKITPEEVGGYHPGLAMKWSLRYEGNLEELSQQIVKRIKKESTTTPPPPSGWLWAVLAIGISLLGYWFFFNLKNDDAISREFVNETVEMRVDDFQGEVENDLKEQIQQQEAKASDQKAVIEFTDHFENLEVQYRNYYEFTNGFQEVQFLKYVGPATGIDFESWSPVNNYGFEHPNIYLVEQSKTQPYFDKTFVYFNTQETDFTLGEIKDQDSIVTVKATYTEPLRLASFHYEYTPQTSYRKHTTYTIKGFLPTETYVFARKGKEWTLRAVK